MPANSMKIDPVDVEIVGPTEIINKLIEKPSVT